MGDVWYDKSVLQFQIKREEKKKKKKLEKIRKRRTKNVIQWNESIQRSGKTQNWERHWIKFVPHEIKEMSDLVKIQDKVYFNYTVNMFFPYNFAIFNFAPTIKLCSISYNL